MSMTMTTKTGFRSPIAYRAAQVLPGGSNGEFGLPDALGTVIERGEGCRLWDTQGREFLDFSMGWGSALVGHARPEIVDAVRRTALDGLNFSYPSRAMVELAERIVAISPACERVRFGASGTEATMYCMRLARAYTGRPLILKFEGAYHGSNDEGVTSLFPSGRYPFPEPERSSAGINDACTLVAPYNDAETTERLIAEHADALGGVIVEPLQRCLTPEPGFLRSLRNACDRHGVPLIFDEVVTGFRLALGGAQEYYGVVPDLVAYGKALGGGMPIGVFGGRADIMDLVREDRLGDARYVWTASTLGGNPTSASAASAAIGVFSEPETYPVLRGLGEQLRAGLRRVLDDTGHAGAVLGDGPLGQVVFTAEPVRDYRSTASGDKAKARAMMLGLFERGVFLNPMGTKLYLSLAHTDAVIEEFLDRLRDTLAAVAVTGDG